MSFKDEFESRPATPEERAPGKATPEMLQDPMVDAELEETLKNFRSSVHAWSQAAYNRPRAATASTARGKVWRLAAGWALGCALIAGGVSGGIVERRHYQENARIMLAQQAEQQRLKAEQQALEEEELLAKVDSDVSREVPSAMEPLARLISVDDTE